MQIHEDQRTQARVIKEDYPNIHCNEIVKSQRKGRILKATREN